jgi:hypothetical protein
MRIDVFRDIVKTDPEALLRSDISAVTDADREALVENLLRLYDESLLDPGIGSGHLYHKLQYPGLTRQLSAYISDRSKGFLARCEALDIARSCELDGIKEDALQVFLDGSDDERVRHSAGHALLRIGDKATKSKMKPLALGENLEDTLDELKGYALQAIWPENLTVDELLQALTVPKRKNLVGAYSGFIRGPLLKCINPSNLPTLLKWVAAQPSEELLPDLFQELIGDIILFAWKHIENVAVLSALGEAILARLRLDGHVAEHVDSQTWMQIINDDQKRRTLLKTIIPLLEDPEKDTYALSSHSTPVILSRDLPWLVDLLKGAQSESSQIILVELIRDVFIFNDRTHVEVVLAAIQDSIRMSKKFEWLWKPIDLDSPEAVSMKAEYHQGRERTTRLQERNRMREEQYSSMMSVLTECETGKPEAFSQLTVKMILQSNAIRNNRILEADLTRLPGWEKSETETRKRIVAAAKAYLEHNNARPDQYFGTQIVDIDVYAGYKAFHLIFTQDPDHLSSVSSDVWEKWASTLLDYPTPFGFRNDVRNALIAIAYAIAPKRIIEALLFLIAHENERDGRIWVIQKISLCRGTEIEEALVTKLSDRALTPISMGDILDELLVRNVEGARHFAEQLVRNTSQSGGVDRETAVIAAQFLIARTGYAGWSVVWPVIELDNDLGLQVIPRVATFDRNYDTGIIKRLPDQALETLFVWLVHTYPYKEDPNEEEWHEVGWREEIGHWRDFVLMELRDRGTKEAVEAIENIKLQLPDLEGLNWTLIEAKNNLRRKSWKPPSPTQILEIAVPDFRPAGRLIEVHDIDEFANIDLVPAQSVNDAMLSVISQLNEKTEMEPFIRKILFDPNETAHGPTELADILTTNLHVKGEKCLAGFVLKGKSFNPVSNQHVSHQFEKLATVGIRVAIFAAVGKIQDEAQRNFSTRAKNEGWLWIIMHAMDLARLFIAYGKICPQDGTPFDNQTQKCKYGHLRRRTKLRRNEIAENIRKSKEEFADGLANRGTVDELMEEFDS